MYCLTVLEYSVQNQVVQRAVLPPKALGDNPLLPLPASGDSKHSLRLCHYSLCLHMAFLLCLSLLFCPLQKHLSLDLGPTRKCRLIHLETVNFIHLQSCFPNKVTCMVSVNNFWGTTIQATTYLKV